MRFRVESKLETVAFRILNRTNTVTNSFYDDWQREPWLATREVKMELSCALRTARSVTRAPYSQ